MRKAAAISKNNSIEIWRTFFTYLIAIYHFMNAYAKPTGLYIATDFFFIVSGFLLAKEESENKFENALQMLKHKVRRLYPHYLLSLSVGWMLFGILKKGPAIPAGGLVLEIGMLQMIGINLTEMVNVPTWYISVLLMDSYIIYFMLANYKKLFVELLVPVNIVIVGTWFYRNYGYLCHSSLGDNITEGIYWNQPLLLGFMLMSVGVLMFRMQKIQPMRGRVAEVILLGSVPLISLVRGRSSWDFLMAFIIAIGVALSFANGHCVMAENDFVKYMSRLSYPLYLNHNMFRILFPFFVKDFSLVSCAAYLILITGYSMMTMLIIDALESYTKRIKDRQHK